MISPVLRKRPKNGKTLKTLHPLEIIQFIHFVQEDARKAKSPAMWSGTVDNPAGPGYNRHRKGRRRTNGGSLRDYKK